MRNSIFFITATIFTLLFLSSPVHTEDKKSVAKFFQLYNQNVYFEAQSADLPTYSNIALERIAVWLKDDPNLYLNVVAFSDNGNSRPNTLTLSNERAKNIADFVINKGIASSRIFYQGLGVPNNPAEANSPDTRMAQLTLLKRVLLAAPEEVAQEEVIAEVIQNAEKEAEEKTILPEITLEQNEEELPEVVEVKDEARAYNLVVIDAKSKQPIDAVITLADGTEVAAVAGVIALNGTGEVEINAKGYFFDKMNITEDMFGTEKHVIALKPIELGEKLNLNDLFFRNGTAYLLDSSKPELERIAKLVNNAPAGVRFEIGGHINVPFTEPKDLKASQLELSEKRARVVYNKLVRAGIDKDRLEYKGYGNSEMIYPEATTEKEYKANRRVELKIIE